MRKELHSERPSSSGGPWRQNEALSVQVPKFEPQLQCFTGQPGQNAFTALQVLWNTLNGTCQAPKGAGDRDCTFWVSHMAKHTAGKEWGRLNTDFCEVLGRSKSLVKELKLFSGWNYLLGYLKSCLTDILGQTFMVSQPFTVSMWCRESSNEASPLYSSVLFLNTSLIYCRNV